LWSLLSVFAVLLVTACGTRLPDSAFETQANTNGTTPVGGGSSTSPTGGGTSLPGPGGSTSAPGAISTSGPGSGPAVGPGSSSQPGNQPTANSSSGPQTGGAGAKNFASDRGVTATTISVCNIVTQGGPFGPYQFTPSYYGAAAYFAALNAAGGVNGRKVNFVSHPDDGSDSGNISEVKTCINQDKAFAFVANNIYQYGGASLVNQDNIPDVGSQPISTAYYIYPNLFPIDGDHSPRNGKTLGSNGYIYRTDEQSLYFKDVQHIRHVGVVYYDQPSSQYGANEIKAGFQAAGVAVSMYQVNIGLPNFASAVAQMKSAGVDMVADAVDQNGSQKLCQAIEQNSGFENQMKIKLSTLANWNASLGSDLSGTPKCANKTWSDAYSYNFDDNSNPQVAQYNAAMRKYFPSDLPHNHQFALEGWIGAMWFTDAVRSCGAKLTRTCVKNYLNRPTAFRANGLLIPNLVSYKILPPSYFSHPSRQCVSAAQWSMSANKWITRAYPSRTCFTATGYKFALTSPT
jgi:branched-chain amino acid transport system substrate-binding protein